MARSNASSETTPGCGVMLSVAFLAVGVPILVVTFVALLIPEWRANHFYVQHTCLVLDKRLVVNAGEQGSIYRPKILIRYTVDGSEYQTWTYKQVLVFSSGVKAEAEEILSQFEIGQHYPCWLDPDNPRKAVLVLGYSWSIYIILLLLPVFASIIAVGMRYFGHRPGRSPELLAALASGIIGGNNFQTADLYPTVPNIGLSRGRGRTLAYCLPLGTLQNWWVVGGMLLVMLFWNGMTSFFVLAVIGSYLKGQPEICLTFFMLPFVVIGLALYAGFFRTVLVTAFCRPATVEIETHPLTPGAATQMYMEQRGPLWLLGLKILVVCEEVAKHTDGENMPIDTKRIHEADIGALDEMWECHGDIRIPTNAMHSFKASHNEIQWKVLISGKADGWFTIAWEYPFVVLPSAAVRNLP